jgi:hypothetical protein
MNRMFVVSIWMNSWLRQAFVALDLDVRDGALEDLQQRLLHALAGHVAADEVKFFFAILSISSM